MHVGLKHPLDQLFDPLKVPFKNFKGVTGSIEFDNKGDPVKAKYFVLQFEKQAYPGKVVKIIEQQAPATVAKKS